MCHETQQDIHVRDIDLKVVIVARIEVQPDVEAQAKTEMVLETQSAEAQGTMNTRLLTLYHGACGKICTQIETEGTIVIRKVLGLAPTI